MKLEWEHSTPETEGMDSRILNQLDEYIKQKRYRLINSVLVVKNGRIVFERYYNNGDEHRRSPIKSIWKSILAIAVGICLDSGIIHSLDDPIGNYLQEFSQNRHPYHKLITIRHLLTMSSGIYWNGGIHYHCPMMAQMMRTKDWTSYLADVDMDAVPGMSFQYKEWDVMLLSAVIGRAFGATAFDFVQKYLYEPLDIASGEWPQSPCGFSYIHMKGEENTNLTARDLVKIGLLFLGKGVYNEKQLISADFVEQAVTPVFTNVSIGSSTGTDSYGFLWWLFEDGYGCRGSGGQEINVMPASHYISVIQAEPTSSAKAYEDVGAFLANSIYF